MLYLICVPIFVLAIIFVVISYQFGYSLLMKICKIVIFVDVVAFIYLYLLAQGYDIFLIVKNNLFK